MHALPPAVPVSSGAMGTPVGSYPASTTQQTTPTITQNVTVSHVPSRTDLLADVGEWGWSELRDYVAAEIITRFGPFPRDARKEYGIFSRYFGAYGQSGIEVAKYAFEICDGWWANAPVSVNRFCKASDPFFTEPIIARLRGASGA